MKNQNSHNTRVTTFRSLAVLVGSFDSKDRNGNSRSLNSCIHLTSSSRQFPPQKTKTLSVSLSSNSKHSFSFFLSLNEHFQFPLSHFNLNFNFNKTLINQKRHAIPSLPRQNPALRAREFQVLQGLPNHRSFLRFHCHYWPQWFRQIQPHGRYKLRPRRSLRPTPWRSTQRPHLRL